MNKIDKILVLAIISIVLLACNLGSTPPLSENQASASPTTPAAEAPTVQPSTPQDAAAPQPSSDLEPCSLITAAEAEAILAEPASVPNTMNGACNYSNAKDSLYMVSASAAQDQQAGGILQGQAMMLGFAGGQLDEARMTKLKTQAEALDYKGFFTELVTASEGATTLKSRLIEDGKSDVVYWAWIIAQSRRQGAYVAVRGQTVVNINLIVADTQTEEAMLTASTSLADQIFTRLPAKFTIAMPNAAPTQQAQIIPTDTVLPPEKTIIGSWERRSSDITENYNLQDNGSYSIEAKNNSTNKVVASITGTFTYDESNIYYVDKDNRKSTESYYLDNEGDLLVINNNVEKAWTRIK